MNRDFAFAWRDALARLPAADGKRFTVVFEHGTLVLELYAPRGHDPQTPHAQDELYVVVAGRGTFVCGDERKMFGCGDALFVPGGLAALAGVVGDGHAARPEQVPFRWRPSI